MPLNYDPPKRCSLKQAAIWHHTGKFPLPDKVFSHAPEELQASTTELRELFLALKLFDCSLKGLLYVYLSGVNKNGELMQSRECAVAHLEGFSMEWVHIEFVNFAASEITINPQLTVYDGRSLEISVRRVFKELYAEQEFEGKWVESAGIREITIDFGILREALAGKLKANAKSATVISAETATEKWLLGKMKQGPPEKTKKEYLLEARKKFDVGQRPFIRAWENAKKSSGNLDWGKPGRKS